MFQIGDASGEEIHGAAHPLDFYVDVEVAAVCENDEGIEVVADDDDADFFSVYLRAGEGVAEVFADLRTRERAEALAAALRPLIVP